MPPSPDDQPRSQRGSSPVAGSRNGSLIGRTRELAALAERLDRAARGEGSVSLISGEPGIGKSRLLVELQGRARAGGWLVLSGRAYDTEGMPPYVPFAEAIAQSLRSTPDDSAAQRLAMTAHEVALLVPELRDHVSAGSPASFGPEADRYRLFQAVTDFLLSLSGGSEATGLLLCLDDLHWADRATLLLFQHLARNLAGSRLLVVAAYRSEEVDSSHPLSGVLAELSREGKDHRLMLGRLTPEETDALVASLGYKPPLALGEAIHRQTDGNPFFVQEVVWQLKSQAPGQGAGGALPEGVRQVIGQRLSRLDSVTRGLLESAAVLGDGFEIGVLRAMTDAEKDEVTPALEASAQAGMLREQGDGYAFGHPLVCQVIYESLSLPRRQELHLRAAAAIEAVHAYSLDAQLSELATHYRLCGTDLAKTIDYATRAGDRATAVYAFDEALRLYDLALEATTAAAGPDSKATVAELQVKRGESLSALGLWPEARSAFDDAAAGLQGERRADVLLMLANAGTSGPPDVPSSRRYAGLVLELALELGRQDLEMAAHALLAQSDQAEGKFKAALIEYRRAYSQSKNFPAVRQHQVFPSFPLALYYAGRIEEAVERGREIADLSLAAHKERLSVITLGNLGLSLTSAGLYDEALQTFASAREVARNHGAAGIQIPLARTVAMSTLVHIATADFLRAETIAEEAREIARSADIILPIVSEGIDLITISIGRGDLSRVDDLVLEVTENLDKGGGAHGALWRTRLVAARAELALARSEWRDAHELSGEAVALARELGRPKYESLSLTSKGKALLGLGRKKEAMPLLAEAVEVARSMGDPSLFLHSAAAALAAGGDEHLATDARLAVERMLANIADAEMRRNFEASASVHAVYKLSGGAAYVPARPVYPDGLSEREVDVLRLIAGGNSNREIASELVISVRTVERHVTNIYGKIGARGKADATSYALKQSLL